MEAAMPTRTVRTIVAQQTAVTVASKTSVEAAARLMKKKNIGALMVVDDGKLVGIFTERDALFRVLAAGRDPATTRLADVMTAQPQTIGPEEPFLHALRIMHECNFRHLPVVEFGRPLGMVSVRDALDDDLYALRVDLAQRQEME